MTERRTSASAPLKVSPEQFTAMTFEEQDAFLMDPATSIRVAEAAGVGSVCGSCGEPFFIDQDTSGHRCNPERLAYQVRKLHQ
jgi:hypothetical protein